MAVNTRLLGNALYQYGPWEGTRVNVTAGWLIKRLEERIEELDWDDVRRDIAPLLSAEQRETLKLWSAPLFLKKARLIKAANVP